MTVFCLISFLVRASRSSASFLSLSKDSRSTTHS